MMTMVRGWGTKRPTSRQPRGPANRGKQHLQWQQIQPAVQPFGQDGVSIHIRDSTPRAEAGAGPSGIYSAGTADSPNGILSACGPTDSSGICSARAAALPPASVIKPDRLLSPFVDDQGRALACCNYVNAKKWMEETNIALPTRYGEGFHREDFEEEHEPSLQPLMIMPGGFRPYFLIPRRPRHMLSIKLSCGTPSGRCA